MPNDLDVEIYKHNNKYYGKIIALNNFENGQLKDIHNSDKTKQDEPLLGKIIIQDLVYNSLDKNWINGKMYSSEKGIVFNFKVVAINRNEIEIEGSKYFFSKTMQCRITSYNVCYTKLLRDKSSLAIIFLGSFRLLIKRWDLNNYNFDLKEEGTKLVNSFKLIL